MLRGLCSVARGRGHSSTYALGAILAPHMFVPVMPGPMPPALPTTERRGLSIRRGSRQRANSARYSLLIWGTREESAAEAGAELAAGTAHRLCRVGSLYLAGLGWPQAVWQLDDPLQSLHQLLKGSDEAW